MACPEILLFQHYAILSRIMARPRVDGQHKNLRMRCHAQGLNGKTPCYFLGPADLVKKNHRKKAPIPNMMAIPIAE